MINLTIDFYKITLIQPALHYTNTIPSCDLVLVHLEHYISCLVVTLLYTLCHSTLRWRTRARRPAVGHKWHWSITVTVLCGVSESIHSFYIIVVFQRCVSRGGRCVTSAWAKGGTAGWKTDTNVNITCVVYCRVEIKARVRQNKKMKRNLSNYGVMESTLHYRQKFGHSQWRILSHLGLSWRRSVSSSWWVSIT